MVIKDSILFLVVLHMVIKSVMEVVEIHNSYKNSLNQRHGSGLIGNHIRGKNSECDRAHLPSNR
jgi:hypothetical protein